MAFETGPRTALVTGGAKRIGRAIVNDLATHGWSVAIHCNSSVAEAEKQAQAIRRSGGNAHVIQADLKDPLAVSEILPAANKAIGPVSLLVNNASLFLPDEIGSLDTQTWQQQFAVNLQAPVFLSEAFAAQLPDNHCGNIINMIDQRVWKLTPQMMSYTLAKSALWAATQTMAQALAPRIRVNGIGPGPTFANPADGEHGLIAEAAGTLFGKPINPAEIAAAIRFLVASPTITGQMLALDNGQHLAWQTPDIVDRTD